MNDFDKQNAVFGKAKENAIRREINKFVDEITSKHIEAAGYGPEPSRRYSSGRRELIEDLMSELTHFITEDVAVRTYAMCNVDIKEWTESERTKEKGKRYNSDNQTIF